MQTYGLYAVQSPREIRRELAAAWAKERVVMFAARKVGDYDTSYAARMRVRLIERAWKHARAV